jgi:hypothetical protein
MALTDIRTSAVSDCALSNWNRSNGTIRLLAIPSSRLDRGT